MTRLRTSTTLIGGALWMLTLLSAGTAFAHHSVQAEFDMNKKLTLTGTIAKVEWINPRSRWPGRVLCAKRA